jgi:FSR family fosmidomycin resistance protein-like MFS transporter
MRKFNLKVLLILSLGHLTTDIYQGAIPAILPFLKEKLSLSYSTAGVIMLASNFTSSIVQPLFGLLSDRKEKPFFLPLGCICAGIGFCLLPVPSRYFMILLLVIFSGLGVASYHPEGFRTAYFFTGQRAATGMSVFSVGGNLGFALGPIIALSVITHFGFSFLPVMIIFSVLFLATLSFSWKTISVPKTLSGENKSFTGETIRGATSPLLVIISTVIIRSWTHAGLITYIPFYYIDHLKGDPIYAGKLVSVFLLGGVIGTLAGSPLADRWGHKRYLVISMAVSSVVLPLIFFVQGFMLFATLGVLGMVLISTFTVTLVMAQRLLPGNLGVVSGLMVGFAIGAGGVGVTILGLIADHFGVPFALKSIAILPFVGFVLSMLLRYPLEQTQPEHHVP